MFSQGADGGVAIRLFGRLASFLELRFSPRHIGLRRRFLLPHIFSKC